MIKLKVVSRLFLNLNLNLLYFGGASPGIDVNTVIKILFSVHQHSIHHLPTLQRPKLWGETLWRNPNQYSSIQKHSFVLDLIWDPKLIKIQELIHQNKLTSRCHRLLRW